MGRVFFVWTTVFALFNTSIFWCLMADAFRSEQAKRLFGFIGVGRHARLDHRLGGDGVAGERDRRGERAARLGRADRDWRFSRWCGFRSRLGAAVTRRGRARRAAPDATPTSSAGASGPDSARWRNRRTCSASARSWSSTRSARRSSTSSKPTSSGGTTPTATARTAILAKLELAAQVLTVLTQIFLTGRLIRWVGLAMALALAAAREHHRLRRARARCRRSRRSSVFTVARRGSNFAITNPAMEVLFTVVPREDKYKAKNIIETFVYRGGDQVGAWIYAGLAGSGSAWPASRSSRFRCRRSGWCWGSGSAANRRRWPRH